jgi:hypothetical protein
MWDCSRNFSKIMKPEIQEREDRKCSEVWLCDTSKDEYIHAKLNKFIMVLWTLALVSL